MDRNARYHKIFHSEDGTEMNTSNSGKTSQNKGYMDGKYRQLDRPESKNSAQSSSSRRNSGSAQTSDRNSQTNVRLNQTEQQSTQANVRRNQTEQQSIRANVQPAQGSASSRQEQKSEINKHNIGEGKRPMPEQQLTQQKPTYRKRKKKRKKAGCLSVLFGIVFILILLALLLYFGVKSIIGQIDSYKLDYSKISMNANDPNISDYQNIVLYGIDDQDNEIRDTGCRTDSIIVASINKKTKEVKLMSIYRDTYVSIDGDYDKINAAYSYGGPELAISTINRNLDLNIQDFATVNFKALADAVDIMGGVELTIETEKELENLNDYIGNMNHINGGNSPKFDKIGTYTFDGNQAVAYARIRYMAGGDHARANHQRLVIAALVQQIKKQPWKIKELIDTVVPQCKTSFTSSELTRLALALPFYKIADSQAYPFDSFDEKYNGIYYGFATTVYSNVQQAHSYLFGTEDYTPTEELGKISEKVKNISDTIDY